MERDVAPERVPLSSIYAGFWPRLGANLIDMVVLMAIGWAWTALPPHPKPLVMLVIALLGAIGFTYTIIFHARYGQTLGKMVAGITVLRTDGSRIGWREAFWRSSVDVAFWAILTLDTLMILWPMPSEQIVGSSLDSLQVRIVHMRSPFFSAIGWVGLVWFYSEVVTLLFNDKKRALHDFIAGTVVARNGTEALVRETESWTGPPITAGRILRVGVRSVGVVGAGAIMMLVYIAGFAWFLTRTDAGVAIGEWRGWFGASVTDIAPGVRLARPAGWSVKDDGANGYSVNALGSKGDASFHLWAVPVDELPERPAGDLSALGPAVATYQRNRSKKALQGTWAAGTDYYAKYAITRSQVMDVDGRPWGEDLLVSHEQGRDYVLINRYTVHGDAVIVVVDGYKAPPQQPLELDAREELVAPIMRALEFSP